MKLVTRISNQPREVMTVFLNPERRALSFSPADSAEKGSPQTIEDATADAIEADPSLASHFRCEPIPSAEASTGGPVAEQSAPASDTKVEQPRNGAKARRSGAVSEGT